jgi:hypothetical protein
MSRFEITLKFYFNESDSYDSDEDQEDIKQKSFDETDFDLKKHLSKYEASYFAEDISSWDFETIPETAKWLPDNKIRFMIETHDEDVTEENILNDLLHDSLEDGPYEGFDNGWVITTDDGKYSYGLLDYRDKDFINVKKIPNNFRIILQLYLRPNEINFDLTSYLKTLDIKEFVDSLSLYSGNINKELVKFLPNNRLCFIVESKETTKEITLDVSTISLEDSAYEGSSGWVVMNTDKTQEIGFIDYRKEEISVEKL